MLFGFPGCVQSCSFFFLVKFKFCLILIALLPNDFRIFKANVVSFLAVSSLVLPFFLKRKKLFQIFATYAVFSNHLVKCKFLFKVSMRSIKEKRAQDYRCRLFVIFPRYIVI